MVSPTQWTWIWVKSGSWWWTERLGVLQSMGLQRIEHDWATELNWWRPTRPSRTNTQKRCPFHYRRLEYKSRKSRDTRSNRQIWPCSTEWSRAKTNRVLPRMHWSYQTPSSNNTREDSTHGHHQMVNTEIRLIIFFAAKDGEALYSQQKQDQELTLAQIMNSLLPNPKLDWRK